MLFQAHRLGYRLEEIVLDYQPRERGKAKSGHPRVLLETLRDMLRYWLKQKHNRIGKRASAQKVS